MIRLRCTPPESGLWRRWVKDCEAATRQLTEEVAAGRRPEISKLYRRKSIKDRYFKAAEGLFFGKCVYCECYIDQFQHGDVEHFRPKGGVTNERDEPVLLADGQRPHPGYWWLAYAWRNLLFSCTACNQASTVRGRKIGKHNRFPVEGRHATGPEEVAVERPLLLNPVEDNPADHLRLDLSTGLLLAESPRGEMSIEIFGLNLRDRLPEGRLQAVDQARAKVLQIVMDPARRAEAGEVLAGFRDGKRAYSMAGRVAMAAMRASLAPVLAMDDGSEAEPTSPFIVGRPIERDEDFFGRESQKKMLEDALRQGQSVEILGERRMGKSSLLRWVARHAGRFQERPVVWLDAQGPEIQSPMGLVRAAARGVGRVEAVEAVLARHRGEGESRAAALAVETLGPAVLLVDEADALVRRAQGFDDGMLDALRAAGQAGRLVWVSAAVDRLRDRFQSDGLTSSFLNDARVVVVGQLGEGASWELLKCGLGEEQIEEVWRQAAGFAYGLQLLGDALQRSPESAQLALDLAANDLESTFGGWWGRRNEAERILLRRCLDGLEVFQCSDAERRKARALVERGLLAEVEERFRLAGTLWAESVQDG